MQTPVTAPTCPREGSLPRLRARELRQMPLMRLLCPMRSTQQMLQMRWTKRIVVQLTVAATLAGCSVGPDYVRPPAEMSDTYKELSNWKVAQPSDALSRGAWWEVYGDPQLNALEEEAMISNQQLASAEGRMRAARALVRVAKADFYPNASVGVSATRTRRSAHFGSSSSSSSTSSPSLEISDYRLPIDVSWEPDLWGRVRRSVESSQASAQASAADLEAARLSLSAELATDYFSLRAIDADKKLVDETVAADARSLQITQNRYAAGVAARSDVVLATAQLETTRASAIDLGVQRAQFEHAIAIITGKPPSALSLPVVPLAATPLVTPPGLPSELLQRRPDVAAAERRVAAANAEIGVAKAAYFPSVSLSASVGLEASHVSDWFSWPSRFWAVGPSLSETVFDGGRRRGQTEQARANYDSAVADYRQSVLTAFQEVEDNLAALRILEGEARVMEDAVKASLESVTLTMNQYKAGTVSYLNVVVVQAAALNTQRSASDLLARRMVASVQLTKALGGGWKSAELSSNEDLARR